MTHDRVALRAAALISAAGALFWVVGTLWNLGVYAVEAASGGLVGDSLGGLTFWYILGNILRCAAFGLGVYVTLRCSIDAKTPWRRTITRAILVSIGGVVVETVLTLAVTLIGSVTISQYPFVDSVDPGLNLNGVQIGLINAAEGLLPMLVTWMPLTVLGCVLLRVWLGAHPEVEEPTVPASRAETPVDH
ncbi:MAG TPA: hypothetical protein VHZ81_02095 [Galbitalea sp.]|nr:hypothetical protein [Galbitalea sp.]